MPTGLRTFVHNRGGDLPVSGSFTSFGRCLVRMWEVKHRWEGAPSYLALPFKYYVFMATVLIRVRFWVDVGKRTSLLLFYYILPSLR